METLLKLLLFVSISISCVLSQLQTGRTPIGTRSISAVSASIEVYNSTVVSYCPNTPNYYYRSFPSSHSIEHFIALVERLENALANTTDRTLAYNRGAEKVAGLLLRRYLIIDYK